MNFDIKLDEGKAKKVMPNRIRAQSLIGSSTQAIRTAGLIPLSENTAKTILRELYEGLREYCEAIGYFNGYKFLDHESITYFLKDFLKEHSSSARFDRYRKLRNGISYYGNDINLETVQEAIIEIPAMIAGLKRHCE